jgi:hypothetical protein
MSTSASQIKVRRTQRRCLIEVRTNKQPGISEQLGFVLELGLRDLAQQQTVANRFAAWTVDDKYEVTSELAPPFDILLGEEMRQAAALRAEATLHSAVDGVLREQRTPPDVHEPELALVGAATATNAFPPSTPVAGLKEETMVGCMGLFSNRLPVAILFPGKGPSTRDNYAATGVRSLS